jgi:hypothetical protein
MSYRKTELQSAVETILGEDEVDAMGLPRAAEECAVQLFLNIEAHQEAIDIIRCAVSDLRDFGSFKFVKEQ